MNNSRQRLSYLLERYTEKTATSDELRELAIMLEKDWLQMEEEKTKEPLHINWQQMLDAILANNRANAPHKPFLLKTLKRSIRYAAVFALIAGAVCWFLTNKEKQVAEASGHFSASQRIAPGRDGAVLTLAGGEQIVLDSLQNGVIASQNGSKVVLKNGQLRYDPAAQTTATVLYNIMSTPKGRQFKMVLPDGTRIWLNSASSVKYPTAFSGSRREVEISGEAYLEVAKDKTHPFIVKTAGMEVEVLGTNFNINTYKDEEAVITTLLEGSIRTSTLIGEGTANTVILKPGQQAQARQTGNGAAGPIRIVDQVAIDKVMAWKNGLFNFEDASLKELMRQISRWYDIEIVFEKGVPDMQFGGKMSRNVELSDVLKALKGSGVHFRIEGRRLIVLP